MNGRQARRRGGVRDLTVGYLLIAGSSFVLLAAGSRLLGGVAFSGLGLVWTVSTVFGIGLALPTEQLIGRRLNVGTPNAVGVSVRWLLALGFLAAGLTLLWGLRTTATESLPALVPSALLAIAGWVALALARGRLAGCGDLTMYSRLLFVEGGTRIVLVGVAAAHSGWSTVLLPLAVSLPMILAALAGLIVHVPSGAPRDGVPDAAASEQVSFVAVAVGFQICLNSAPLLLEWRSGGSAPASIGAYVAASTYFRAPSLLVGGINTNALVELAHAWGEADLVRFRAARSRALRQVSWLLGLSSLALTLVAPVALKIYYGRGVDLPLLVLLALPISTVIAVDAAVAVQPLLAAGHGRVAGSLWLGGAAVTCLLLAASHGLNAWFGVALVAGPTMTLVGALIADGRIERANATRN